MISVCHLVGPSASLQSYIVLEKSLVEVFSVTQCDLLNAGTIVTNYLR